MSVCVRVCLCCVHTSMCMYPLDFTLANSKFYNYLEK